MRTSRFSALFAWMVRGFEVSADVCQGEPGGFELTASIEDCLIHEVTALRIAAGAERMNRQGADAWRKLNNTDVARTRNTISAFLSSFGRGLERENSAIVSIDAINSDARF